MIRSALAWTLYGLGHALWWSFDRQWCDGMRWGTYRAYQRLMAASEAAQAHGNGPWFPLADGASCASTTEPLNRSGTNQ